MSTPEDLTVIRDYCNRAALAAVADLIRAQGGELDSGRLALPVGLNSPPAIIIDETEVEPASHVRDVVTTPVPEVLDERRIDKSRIAFWCFGVLAGLGALAAAAWIVITVVQAIVAALTAIVPMVTGILCLVALVVLLSFLRGGRSFTFSGSGRMH